MRESKIEKELCKRVKAKGGICLKFTSPGFNGVPDRIVMLPDGHMGFVETKAPGKKPRLFQEHVHLIFKKLGQPVFVLDDIDNIDALLYMIETYLPKGVNT